MKMGNNRLPIVEMVLFDVFNPTKDLQGEALLMSNIFVKGRVRLTHQMNFRKSAKGRGGGAGSFSIQKFILQIWGTLNGAC